MTATIPTSTRTVVLQNYISEKHDLDLSSSPSGTFASKVIPIPNPVSEDSLLVQTIYLSNEPGLGFFLQESINFDRSDRVPIPLGSPVTWPAATGRIMQVGGNEANGQHKVGDIVQVLRSYWADYVVVKKDMVKLRKAIPGIPSSAYLGGLGVSGATAYWALKDVLKPKPSHTLVISGAAGAVGNVAVQFAKKVMGVKRVVGIAGTDEKCKWLKSIGADEAVNYKSPRFTEDLEKATPEKVDLFLDNVGGSILDEVMMRMNPHGAICIVGIMAHMKDPQAPVVMRNYGQILVNRLSLKGFRLHDYVDRLDEAEEVLTSAAVAGKLVLNGAETIVDVHGKVEEIPRWFFRITSRPEKRTNSTSPHHRLGPLLSKISLFRRFTPRSNNLFLNDPYPRFFLEKSAEYDREDLATLPLGTPFSCLAAIGRIVQVGGNETDGLHKIGDVVEVLQPYWADYVVVKKDKARPRNEIPGVSIYAAVGNVAVQLKKVMGVKRVVAIAGTDEKCKWMKSIGAAGAVNYKSPTFIEDLKKATPDKVDSYLDNVGGSILDEVMMRMKPHGVICAVGFMSRKFPIVSFRHVVTEWFTIWDHFDRLGKAEEALISAVNAGKLVLNGQRMSSTFTEMLKRYRVFKRIIHWFQHWEDCGVEKERELIDIEQERV
ncbi:NAD-binding protein [Fomitiporia mediterranea MF3/22]|uniref:NAD-binding protein n=1 Tax=Fomitiporia mediterranea (strain MF3/22) TaxID=694068 RepID=UPI000440986D|nr:NAD-binding protein [Fomitiporia mediterranea MF3/22]EJD02775.1 NAD-binding protein [Fomitiporia mediterranea MF3/22]